jgi:hypothetical protein
VYPFNNGHASGTIVAVGKQKVLHIQRARERERESVCVCVALVNHHARSMPSIIMSSVTCLYRPYFSILSHNRHNFWKKLLAIKCLF